ncbi:cell envelope integrity protein CreD [Pedobacter cryoconitis]|uniref:Inner membrane protein n=1 Tax=Pedobacter cryoconitis TaxID=188932 RepID=A0A327T1V1_9SPHI|nr:cell envelope integrity protein CreD [Pedobacter cryoconitis]RAJ35620.1 inner membrane protein [Pedobacter cryoconitis]
MNYQQEKQNNGFRTWFSESVIVKLCLIGILTLLLLIPSSLVQNLIVERQARQQEVNNEISDKWSGSQLVEGPILVIPYKTTVNHKDSAGKVTTKEVLTNIYILPETLNITGKAEPQLLHRGIFDAVVYNSKISVNGKFSAMELRKSGINPDMVQWDKAKVDIGLSDLKGLKNNPVIKLAGKDYAVEPDFTTLSLFTNNLIIQPDLSAGKNTALDFSFDLDLRGSNELSFLHIGKSTTVKIDGSWGNPKFTGRYLPEQRNVAATAFSATWKMPYFNRPFSQQWINENSTLVTAASKENPSMETNVQAPLRDGAFGVQFILPVDQYQKTMRSGKYSILIIMLTFISLFFTELLNKRKVHLLQYVLIGAAMIIYYTLLLSFSERVGFNLAYLIASVATVSLIGSFIAALLKNKKPALIFVGILTVFYGFVYVIIQLQDLALLFGSVGLFIIVAALMYLSAKIDWNRNPLAEVPDSSQGDYQERTNQTGQTTTVQTGQTGTQEY